MGIFDTFGNLKNIIGEGSELLAPFFLKCPSFHNSESGSQDFPLLLLQTNRFRELNITEVFLGFNYEKTSPLCLKK